MVLGHVVKLDQTETPYDAFISHSHADATVVEELAHNLTESFNCNLWLDRWILIPGGLWQQEIAKAIEQARTCLVCLGSHTPRGWFEQEIQRARNKQVAEPRDKPERDKFRVIPVILPGGDLKLAEDFLELHTAIVFNLNVYEEWSIHCIHCGLRGVPPGRPIKKKIEAISQHDQIVGKLKKLDQLGKEGLIHNRILLEKQRQLIDQLLQLDVDNV
jgi:TIR domain